MRGASQVVGQVDNVHEVPPGVDVDEFVPRERAHALRDLIAEAEQDPQDGDERRPDPGNAARLSPSSIRRSMPNIAFTGGIAASPRAANRSSTSSPRSPANSLASHGLR